jgi:hypothetical protein
MASSIEPAVRGVEAGDDWAVQAADTVDRVVTSIADKTTGPLTTVARGLVYGLLAAILGVAVLVLLAIALVRVLDIYVADKLFDEPVYVAYLVASAIFLLAGWFAWRKRRPKDRGERA